MKKKTTPTPNLVAKHALDFNKSAVFTDRKKALKKGYRKHKSALKPMDAQGYSIAA